MITRCLKALFGLLLCCYSCRLVAQPAMGGAPGLTHLEQAHAMGLLTHAEKAEWAREQILGTRYGDRGLQRIFKNFDGSHYIDPEVPGVVKNFRALGSSSGSQSIGARRTLIFATKAYNDRRFQLEAVDQPVPAIYGRTDKDLVLKHRQTGTSARFEVKDAKYASQQSDIARLKGQINKMAAEYQRTGQLQVWVNRQPTLAAIKEYARKNGIPVYENIHQSDFNKVLNDVHRQCVLRSRVKMFTAGLGILSGAALLYSGAMDGPRPGENEIGRTLHTGRQGSILMAGGSFLASGAASSLSGSSILSPKANLALSKFSKWGSHFGIVGCVLGEGFGIASDYNSWDEMSARDQSLSVAQHTIGIGALIASFGVGFFLTIETGPAAILFGLASAATTYGLTQAAVTIVNTCYDRLDAEQREAVRSKIYEFYGVH